MLKPLDYALNDFECVWMCFNACDTEDPVMGRELVVTQDVEAGEVLVLVPPELCISVEPLEGGKNEEVGGEDFRLASELTKVAESAFWEAYRDVWPSKELLEEMMPVARSKAKGVLFKEWHNIASTAEWSSEYIAFCFFMFFFDVFFFFSYKWCIKYVYIWYV